MKLNTGKKVKQTIIVPILVSGLIANSIIPSHVLASSTIEQQQEFNVIVVYKNSNGKEKIKTHAVNVKQELDTLHAVSVTLSHDGLRTLQSDPDIAYIQHDEEIQLLSQGPLPQWNVEAVNAHKAWEEGFTGSGVKVAVVDSGVSLHPELNVKERISFLENDPGTQNDESSPEDFDGHGTHVAGIIAAKKGGGTIGGRDVVGVSPDVELYSLKVIDVQSGSILDLIKAIDWSIENEMDIVNMSLGLSSDSPLLRDAVNRAYAAGILLIGASGNDGVGTPVNYPANYDSVIAVSSVTQLKTISSFSSTGQQVEFTAPGSSIISTYKMLPGQQGTYEPLSGTSMAAPHVAGFLALLKQKNPHMSASELREELQWYVDDLGDEGRDELFGYGFINYLALDTEPPANITNLLTSSVSDQSISLSWTNPTDEDFEKALISLNDEMIGETTGNTFTIHELLPDTEYQIVISSTDKRGNKSDGVLLVVQTLASSIEESAEETEQPVGEPIQEDEETQTITLEEINHFQVSSKTSHSISVEWSNPDHVDFEKVNLYLNGELTSEVSYPNTSYTFSQLASSTQYAITAKAVYAGSESEGIRITVETEPLHNENVEDETDNPSRDNDNDQNNNNDGRIEEDRDDEEADSPSNDNDNDQNNNDDGRIEEDQDDEEADSPSDDNDDDEDNNDDGRLEEDRDDEEADSPSNDNDNDQNNNDDGRIEEDQDDEEADSPSNDNDDDEDNNDDGRLEEDGDEANSEPPTNNDDNTENVENNPSLPVPESETDNEQNHEIPVPTEVMKLHLPYGINMLVRTFKEAAFELGGIMGTRVLDSQGNDVDGNRDMEDGFIVIQNGRAYIIEIVRYELDSSPVQQPSHGVPAPPNPNVTKPKPSTPVKAPVNAKPIKVPSKPSVEKPKQKQEQIATTGPKQSKQKKVQPIKQPTVTKVVNTPQRTPLTSSTESIALSPVSDTRFEIEKIAQLSGTTISSLTDEEAIQAIRLDIQKKKEDKMLAIADLLGVSVDELDNGTTKELMERLKDQKQSLLVEIAEKVNVSVEGLSFNEAISFIKKQLQETVQIRIEDLASKLDVSIIGLTPNEALTIIKEAVKGE
ncbi:S8 family serine peptidase [Alkalihalobacterium bogoriense]|uniref:S8 family serine peptidase n=1 Tax=Alkalihalobacterium bogoriense TaxID=246272 RepID=UPI0006887991|nr:S8 family serine peptidase [Alkalihalobacterium bogoriense]